MATNSTSLPARVAASAGMLLGVLVLAGWGWSIPWLKSGLPGYVTMKPNTAFALALAGASLWCLSDSANIQRLRISRWFALACAMVGAITLVEYALGPTDQWLNIDQVLFAVVEDAARTTTPGRMAITSAWGFLTLGAALFFLDSGSASARAVSAACLWASIAIPLGVLIGYVYHVIPVEGVGQGFQMALHTTIGFLCIGAGSIAARPERGIARVLRSDGPGGLLARQLVPVAFAAPVVFGLLRLGAVSIGLLDATGGDAAVTVATAFLLAWATWRIAQDLDGASAARRAAEHALAERNAVLETTNVQLSAARFAADEANRAKSEFLSRMSHELRTPLNSVIGFVGVLQRGGKDRMTRNELQYLERIGSNGRHLLGLINDILDLARVEARRVEVNLESVSLAELVGETVGELQGRVLQGQVAIRADVPEGLLPIETDTTKLKQIVINLVGNALKFTRDGSVTIRVVADDHGKYPRRLDVIDTGIGIAPHRLEAIFEAFEQAESETATKYGGTGLGLSISRAFAALLGYRIMVTSTEGVGSIFSVCFDPSVSGPAAPTARDSIQDSATDEEIAIESLAPRSTVLVIADRDDVRGDLVQQLRELPVDVITAGTDEASVQLALTHRPDVILIEFVISEMSGWDALRRLKMTDNLASSR